jgi:predicted transcriptional regulator
MATLDRRFDVRMSPELTHQLNELAEQNNMTRAEVFRRAIGLYKVAKSVTNRAGKVLLEEPDQNVRELVGI